MPWIKTEYDCGNCIFTTFTFSTRYGSKGLIHYSKVDAKGETKQSQIHVNQRRSQMHADILTNANFKEGDYFITLTFGRGKLPDSKEKIMKVWNAYIKKIKRVYAKAGVELKYLGRLQTENCRPHFHILFNAAINISDFPAWPYGTPEIRILDSRGFHNFGSYILRSNAKDEEEENEPKAPGRLLRSRNLIDPQPKVKRIKSPTWTENPQPKKGYYIDKTTLENGYTENPYNGATFRYQHYVQIKNRKKKKSERLLL